MTSSNNVCYSTNKPPMGSLMQTRERQGGGRNDVGTEWSTRLVACFLLQTHLFTNKSKDILRTFLFHYNRPQWDSRFERFFLLVYFLWYRDYVWYLTFHRKELATIRRLRHVWGPVHEPLLFCLQRSRRSIDSEREAGAALPRLADGSFWCFRRRFFRVIHS